LWPQISPDRLYFTESPATPGLCRGSLMEARLEAIREVSQIERI
jgi:hypothetical protein